MENSGKKKRNPFVVFLKVLLIFVAVILVLVGGWIGFSAINKTDSLKHLPEDFFISVHADSVWDAVEPVLDLQAADLFLTNQETAGTRKLLMELRASDLRTNKWVKFAASREVTAAIYTSGTTGSSNTETDSALNSSSKTEASAANKTSSKAETSAANKDSDTTETDSALKKSSNTETSAVTNNSANTVTQSANKASGKTENDSTLNSSSKTETSAANKDSDTTETSAVTNNSANTVTQSANKASGNTENDSTLNSSSKAETSAANKTSGKTETSAANKSSSAAENSSASTASYEFVAVLDFSWLSFATRLAPLVLPRLNIKGLEYNKQSGFFEYTNKDSKYFVKTLKNLVIVSSDEFLLAKAANTETNYSDANRKMMTGKSEVPIRITANSKQLAALALGTEGIAAELTEYISDTDLTSLDLTITNENINVKANFPLSKEMLENGDKSLTSIITQKSSVPAFVSRLDSSVQYYTLLNAGTLEELKNAAFPLLENSVDAAALWDKSNGLCKSFLNLTLEELLFSWTGKEFAVFGLENKNDPIFAIQIADENQRQYVFDKILSSFLIKDNSSLILDGIRLSRLELPKFLQDVLGLFNISLPYPYFAVRDGFIYFSESAENLSSVYMALKKDSRLTQTENWKAVSSNQSAFNTVSLFYNLERSIPFFLRQNASLSNILELYSLGRFDVRFRDNTLEIQLQAIANSESTSNVVKGFPLELTGRNDGKLFGTDKSIFWVENGKTALKMDYPSTEIFQKTFNDKIYIAPQENGSENLWIVNELGDVFVLDKTFQMIESFPVYTGEKPSANPVVAKDNTLIFTTESKNLLFINPDGTFEKMALPLSGGIKASVSLEYYGSDEIISMYDKSFLGKILTVKNRCLVPEEDLALTEIAFGSPALKAVDGDLYKAFVTQRGNFYLWKNNQPVENFPVKLDGVFNENAIAGDHCFYVISNDCTLSKITFDGDILSVKFSYTTAENPFLKIIDDNIYACGDGNTLYAFNNRLELIPDFPVAGWGFPVLGDVNGDNKKDLFVLSIDKKLNVYDLK